MKLFDAVEQSLCGLTLEGAGKLLDEPGILQSDTFSFFHFYLVVLYWLLVEFRSVWSMLTPSETKTLTEYLRELLGRCFNYAHEREQITKLLNSITDVVVSFLPTTAHLVCTQSERVPRLVTWPRNAHLCFERCDEHRDNAQDCSNACGDMYSSHGSPVWSL